MRYAIKRMDGGLSVMTLLPRAISFDGETFLVSRVQPGTLYALNIKGEELSAPFNGSVESIDENSVPGCRLIFPAVADELAKHEGVQYDMSSVMKISAVPEDRTYRNAWTHDGKKVCHDMVKAREVHRELIRRAREPLLKALDVDYQRADEQGSTMVKQTIAARKQTLRDLPADPRIEAAQTIDELKAIGVPK